MTLEVHSSLSSFGKLEGGAETVCFLLYESNDVKEKFVSDKNSILISFIMIIPINSDLSFHHYHIFATAFFKLSFSVRCKSMRLIKLYCVNILFQNPQKANVMLFPGKLNQFCAKALTPEEIIHIQFNNFFSFYMNHSLNNPVIINPDVIKDFGFAIFFDKLNYLQFIE